MRGRRAERCELHACGASAQPARRRPMTKIGRWRGLGAIGVARLAAALTNDRLAFSSKRPVHRRAGRKNQNNRATWQKYLHRQHLIAARPRHRVTSSTSFDPIQSPAFIWPPFCNTSSHGFCKAEGYPLRVNHAGSSTCSKDPRLRMPHGEAKEAKVVQDENQS